MKRKILALLLACMMVISMVPATVFAESDVETDAAQEVSCTCTNPGVPENTNEVVEMPETCVSWGHKVYRCTECGLMRTELTVKPDSTKHVDAVVDSETGAVKKDHLCDHCGKELSKCADTDNNHECNYCGKKVSDCKDEEPKNHKCDVCGEDYGDPHKAAEGKHTCAYCGGTLTTCLDENKDHECDVCGLDVDTGCVDVNPADHKCDYCKGTISVCLDKNKDHVCDICGVTTMGGECADTNPKDHVCDYCGEKLSECEDTDQNHKCDYCGEAMGGSCADGNKDHKCDYCGTKKSDCSDVDPKDHVCDYCNGTVGGDECVDNDKDHKCDHCEKAVSKCSDFPAQEGGYLPTCSTTGLSYVKCGLCGERLVAPTVLPMLDHTWGETYNDPTCERDGYLARWCKNEGCTAQETVWDEGTQQPHTPSEATCKADQVCTKCNVKLADALAHTPSDDLCVATQDCFVCGQEFTLSEDVLEDHKPSNATCAADQVCTVCNVKLADKLAHTPSEATCEADQVCTVCGVKIKDKLAHTPETVKGTPATYVAKGLTDGSKCAKCKCTLEEQKVIPQLVQTVKFVYVVTRLDGSKQDFTNLDDALKEVVVTTGFFRLDVYMVVGEDGARIEAFQWDMWFDNKNLQLFEAAYDSEAMKDLAGAISTKDFANANGRVRVSANAPVNSGYVTCDAGDYHLASLTFQVNATVTKDELVFEFATQFTRPNTTDFDNEKTDFELYNSKCVAVKMLGNAVETRDYVVDVNDLAVLLRALKPNNDMTEFYTNYWMFDINQDGAINGKDLELLRELIVAQGLHEQ